MRHVFNDALFRQYAVVFAINLNCLSFGLGFNWPSPAMVKLTNASEAILSRPLEQEEVSWIVSMPFLIMAVGGAMASILIDMIGRKYCLILASVIKMVGALLTLFVCDAWMLMLSRAIDGVTQGLVLGVLPVYVTEIACTEVRGALGVMLHIFSSIGSVITLSVGPFISYFNLNLMFALTVFVTIIPTVFLPDSPTFLYSKGKHEESKKVLVFLRCSESEANEELKEYATNKNDEKLGFVAIFRNTTFLKSFGIAVSICCLIFLLGNTCVMMYLQTILIDTQTNIRSEVASAIVGGIQLAASFSTLLTTERFGRKSILILTLIGMTIGMVGLGTFFKLSGGGTVVSGFLNFLPLLALIIAIFCYNSGIGALVWVVIAEIYDDRSRGIGTTLPQLIATIPSFLMIRYFSSLINAVGPALTFWISAVFCVILTGFIALFLPETKGKSFAEIQHALGGTSKA